MSRSVFSSAVLLLFVVWMCGTSGGAFAEANPAKEIGPFAGTTRVSLRWKEVKGTDEAVSSLRISSLVEVNGDVFAIGEAQCKKGSGADCCTGIASKHLRETGGGNPTEISARASSLFCAEFSEGGATEGIVKARNVMRPATLVRGNDIYMLFGKHSSAAQTSSTTDSNGWGLFLAKGGVVEEGNEKKIKWNETYAVKSVSSFLHVLDVFAVGGSGVVMNDGALAFPVQVTDKDGKEVLMVLYFIQPGNKWELSAEAIGEGCRDPSIVEWGGNRIFMMASCAGGYHDVYMSILGSGKNWYHRGPPITRVWGNSRDREGYGVRSGFTTATIEGKEVMLVTLPVYSGDGEGKGRLHLWLTDNTRVYDVGPVSREGDDAAASSLLMKSGNTELISLYEKKEGDGESYSLVSVRLTEKLERIKSVVRSWTALDDTIEKCAPPPTDDMSQMGGRVYNPPFEPTDGLVGFLSGNLTETVWRDEYLCVNAAVHGGVTKTENGVTFKGAKAGAEWPVAKQGQNQPYYFVNNEFTLVATVTIHEVPERSSSPIPLMGVRMNDTASSVLFGLSYTHDRKWSFHVDKRGTPEIATHEWQLNQTYQVALRMDHADDYTVVIDGEEVVTGKRDNDELFGLRRISRVYLGADGEDSSAGGGHMTVTSLLLYNRIVTFNHLKKLKEGNCTTLRPVAEVAITAPTVEKTVEEAVPMMRQETVVTVQEREPVTVQETVVTVPAVKEQRVTQPTEDTEQTTSAVANEVTGAAIETGAESEREPGSDPAGGESAALSNADELSQSHAPGHDTPVPLSGVAGSELVAGDHTVDLSERHASGHEPPAPNSHHAESGSGVRPDGRFALLGDAKLILQDLNADSTVRVCVSRVLVLLLLGLCGLVAVF